MYILSIIILKGSYHPGKTFSTWKGDGRWPHRTWRTVIFLLLKMSDNSVQQNMSNRNKPQHQTVSTRNKPMHQNVSIGNKPKQQNAFTQNKSNLFPGGRVLVLRFVLGRYRLVQRFVLVRHLLVLTINRNFQIF